MNNQIITNRIAIFNLIMTLISTIAIAYFGITIDKSIKEKELNQKYIELAISILKDEPKESNINFRKCAIEVLVKCNPPVALSDSLKNELLTKALPDGFWNGRYWEYPTSK